MYLDSVLSPQEFSQMYAMNIGLSHLRIAIVQFWFLYSQWSHFKQIQWTVYLLLFHICTWFPLNWLQTLTETTFLHVDNDNLRVRFKGFYSQLAFSYFSSQWSLISWLLRNFSSSLLIYEIRITAICSRTVVRISQASRMKTGKWELLSFSPNLVQIWGCSHLLTAVSSIPLKCPLFPFSFPSDFPSWALSTSLTTHSFLRLHALTDKSNLEISHSTISAFLKYSAQYN